jgi:hypothetical protein
MELELELELELEFRDEQIFEVEHGNELDVE